MFGNQVEIGMHMYTPTRSQWIACSKVKSCLWDLCVCVCVVLAVHACVTTSDHLIVHSIWAFLVFCLPLNAFLFPWSEMMQGQKMAFDKLLACALAAKQRSTTVWIRRRRWMVLAHTTSLFYRSSAPQKLMATAQAKHCYHCGRRSKKDRRWGGLPEGGWQCITPSKAV